MLLLIRELDLFPLDLPILSLTPVRQGKGQVISEGLFGVFDFPKKTTQRIMEK